MLGLGVDETYVVAAGRALRWGYFDHPPAVWWLAWAGARLFGTASPLGPRLPFIALFAASSWLMYSLTRATFSPRAGLYAVLALNCAPVLGVTAGGWLLPDGPLVFFLLASATLLVRALGWTDASPRPADGRLGWWLAAGVCAGLALCSKYTAILTVAGFGLWFVATVEGRRALTRAGPWVALLFAVGVFAPVVAWNATHGWASFAFQGGRAGAARLHPLAPFGVLGGELLFLLPWLGVPLLLLLVEGLRRGPADRARYLLCCAALPAVVAFPVIALWSSGKILFHWGTPGWLMLFPLLGDSIARRIDTGRAVRRVVVGTAALVAAAVLLVGVEFRTDFARDAIAALDLRADPNAEAVAWTDVRDALEQRGLLAGTALVAAANWHDAGKIDAALGGAATVAVLDRDARQYGLNAPLAAHAGQQALVVLREGQSAPDGSVVGATRLALVPITHDGRALFAVTVDRATIAAR